ncbi:PA3496 family putative envelope integrity protein [Gilvimarinus xylanilyticus]|uniref:Uncharacterized protein n=1 Tax=Gilvimarinus xylanilyticus TaxID=2944139 RepID=A0A9X2I5Q7_9GAMM|nr:hypothetical protein [Gilvimarinus xylanilyticus]MCP8899387.1 hypothetical protein [Gilvimarinus xylanilyticus]
MTVDHDDDTLMDLQEQDRAQEQPVSIKDSNQRQLEMRRRLEDRLEKRRLRDELGFDELWDPEI